MADIGFEAAKADWDEIEKFSSNPRPYTYEMWRSLTFGQQEIYGRRECQTKGAIYKSRIKANKIEFSVHLPPSLAMNGLTQEEARSLEWVMHKKMEDTIVWILRRRQLLRSYDKIEEARGA